MTLPVLGDIDNLRQMKIADFIALDYVAQQKFLQQFAIDAFKNKENATLFKKYIALTVLMLARHDTEDKALFNLTAQFRNFLAYFGLDDLRLNANLGKSSDGILYNDEKCISAASNGYRLFHISDMGFAYWKRRYLYLGLDSENHLVTEAVETVGRPFGGTETRHTQPITWDNLDNDVELRLLLAEIKKASTYENTLAYDLLCAAMFCANGLFILSLNCGYFSLIAIPLALAVNVAIYSAVIPPVLVLFTMEHLLVNPIKWLFNSVTGDPHEKFIEEVMARKPGLA